MPRLTAENTNALAHRVAGDTLVYECPNCDYGEVPVAALLEDDTARCIDCRTRYALAVEAVEHGPAAEGPER